MIDWAERAVCLLLSLGFLINALVVRRIVGAWTFPAVLYSLLWFLVTFIPLASFPSAHVYPIAMLYLLAGSVAVSAGAFAGGWKHSFEVSRRVKASNPDYYGSAALFICFLVAFGCTIACLLLNTAIQGISLSQLFTNLSDSASEYAQRRYSSDIVANVYQQAGNVLAYLCAGLGGLIVTSSTGRSLPRRTLITVAALFPSIFVMTTQSAKGMLFLCLAIFYGGILVGRIQHGHTNLITKRTLPTVALMALALIPFITFSFLARGVHVGAGQTIFETLAPYWASYTSGHLFAFSDWFGYYNGYPSSQSYDDPGTSGGFYTFMFIFKLMGDNRYVPIGLYDEFLSIPPYIQTNIYTSYRGLIQDFGLPGSLLVLGVMSAFAHRAFRAILLNSRPILSVAFTILTFAYTYQSFAASSLTWATLPVGIMLIAVILFGVRITSHVDKSKARPDGMLAHQDHM